MLRNLTARARAVVRRVYRIWRPTVRVIVFGEFDLWAGSIAEAARLLPRVVEVAGVANPAAPRPAPAKWGAEMRNLLVPIVEQHVRDCPPGYHTLVPSLAALETFADKGKFADYVACQGLDHLCPATYRSPAEAVYPCVIKRVDLSGGRGIVVATDEQRARQILGEELWRDKPIVLQEFVGGDKEYVTHAVSVAGCIVWHCSYEYAMRGRTDEIRHGIEATDINEFAASADVIRSIEAFLRPLDYSGPLNVDYRLKADGQIVVFEINPRLGGSLIPKENQANLVAALTHIARYARRGR